MHSPKRLGDTGFACPACNAPTLVSDSRRSIEGTIRRRRRCVNTQCEYRFTTEEFAHGSPDWCKLIAKRMADASNFKQV